MSQKEWYRKWWGIIIAILILPLFAIWYIWAKSNWSKNVKIGATVVVSILTIIALAASSSNKPQTPNSVAQQSSQTTTNTNQTQASVKTTPAKPLTIQDKLWQAVDTGLKSRKGIDISYDASDPSDKVAFIEHTDPEPFDSQSFIRQSYTILVLFGREAFKIDGVDSINVQNKTYFTDQYGNKKLSSGVTIDMHKAEFNKFNWDNLKYQPVSNQIQAASDVYIIAPALQPYKDSQLYLSLSYSP